MKQQRSLETLHSFVLFSELVWNETQRLQVDAPGGIEFPDEFAELVDLVLPGLAFFALSFDFVL